MVREFTALENVRALLSDMFLWWALCLLPDHAPEKNELSGFLVEYMKQSLKRRKNDKI